MQKNINIINRHHHIAHMMIDSVSLFYAHGPVSIFTSQHGHVSCGLVGSEHHKLTKVLCKHGLSFWRAYAIS